MSYCHWDHSSEVNKQYHDSEWGVPLYDDKKQFEYLMLEVMQCGLNWDLVINKRAVLAQCFAAGDYDKVALYTAADIERILHTPQMIKSPRKIAAIINNARCFRQIRAEYGSFCNYLWGFSGGKTILYDRHDQGQIPASNGLAAQISKDLKQRGFKYLGPIVVYSHLQACGIINDHDRDCPRYQYIVTHYPTVRRRRWAEKDVRQY